MMIPLTSLAYDVEVGGIYYNLDHETQSASVTHGDEKYDGEVYITSSIRVNGIVFSVTSIDNYAFQFSYSLSSITISPSVTSIGNSAFQYCSSLSSITIPPSVTSIGNSAFDGCSSLSSITIPNSVTSIGNSAFQYCSSLSSITIPSSIAHIGDFAFRRCTSLTSIRVDSQNATFDSREDCNAIIRTSDNTLIVGCKSTVIPNSVSVIGKYAFYGCSSLSSISIPNSVTSIGKDAFGDCSYLSSITIPNSVRSIAIGAFEYCSSLSSITIPNSVTSIGTYAFSNCSALSSINIPNSITSIRDATFSGCRSLSSITIPPSVTSIGDRAFYECSSLSSITIPNSITSIGKEAFMYCNSLSSVICEALTPPTCGENVFYRSKMLYVYEPTIDAYRAANQWSEFSNIEPIQGASPTSTIMSISNLGAGTYCSYYDLDFTGLENIKAYVASEYNYDTGVVLLTRVYEVPAYIGFIVMANEGTYSVPCKEVEKSYDNLLKGTTSEIDLSGDKGGYSNYLLRNGSKGLMFYLINGSTTLPANSSYLHIPANTMSESRTLSLSFADDSEETCIGDVVDGGNTEQAPVYNLSGQRVSAPKNGVFVKNGKIVIMK